MEKYTKTALKNISKDDLVVIVEDIAEFKNKELDVTGNKDALIQIILDEQEDQSQEKSLPGGTDIREVVKTFDTVIDGERFSLTAGYVGPVPEELLEELDEAGITVQLEDEK